MSATLKWKPAKASGHNLPDALKYALQKNPSGQEARHFGEASIGYLEGLRDAGIDGAEALLGAIEKHGDVLVWWEY